ncbi:MAG: class II glutamine amidotransferase [Thermoplasmata archaeon]
MCRMVGVVFRGEFPAEVLMDLKEVARVGKIPGEKEPGHKDGWGIVSFVGGSPIYMERRFDAVFEDHHFEPAVRQVAKLPRPNILVAHARASSGTPATMANTHPFIAGGIVLAHNGTVFDYEPRTRYKPIGDTDSEKLLMSLAEKMDDKGHLKEAFKSLVIEDIATRRISGAVLLVTDGKELCGFRDYAPDRSATYYNLYLMRRSDHIVVFQETLLDFKDSAQQVKKGELVTVDMDLNVARELIT